jgi:putative oxidoreductase
MRQTLIDFRPLPQFTMEFRRRPYLGRSLPPSATPIRNRKSLKMEQFPMTYAATLERYSPYALGVLRIVTALIFLLHGAQKLFGFPALPAGGAMPEIFSFMWFGGALEFFGGLLLLGGLFTRCVAFVLAGEMAVAYWMFHAPKSIFPVLNGGDAAILYCFVFLYIVFAGPGAGSIDQAREGSRH